MEGRKSFNEDWYGYVEDKHASSGKKDSEQSIEKKVFLNFDTYPVPPSLWKKHNIDAVIDIPDVPLLEVVFSYLEQCEYVDSQHQILEGINRYYLLYYVLAKGIDDQNELKLLAQMLSHELVKNILLRNFAPVWRSGQDLNKNKLRKFKNFLAAVFANNIMDICKDENRMPQFLDYYLYKEGDNFLLRLINSFNTWCQALPYPDLKSKILEHSEHTIIELQKIKASFSKTKAVTDFFSENSLSLSFLMALGPILFGASTLLFSNILDAEENKHNKVLGFSFATVCFFSVLFIYSMSFRKSEVTKTGFQWDEFNNYLSRYSIDHGKESFLTDDKYSDTPSALLTKPSTRRDGASACADGNKHNASWFGAFKNPFGIFGDQQNKSYEEKNKLLKAEELSPALRHFKLVNNKILILNNTEIKTATMRANHSEALDGAYAVYLDERDIPLQYLDDFRKCFEDSELRSGAAARANGIKKVTVNKKQKCKMFEIKLHANEERVWGMIVGEEITHTGKKTKLIYFGHYLSGHPAVNTVHVEQSLNKKVDTLADECALALQNKLKR